MTTVSEITQRLAAVKSLPASEKINSVSYIQDVEHLMVMRETLLQDYQNVVEARDEAYTLLRAVWSEMDRLETSDAKRRLLAPLRAILERKTHV